jgi:hypothetical protein
MFVHELKREVERLERRVEALEDLMASILGREPDSVRVVLTRVSSMDEAVDTGVVVMSITTLVVGGTATASLEYFNSADPTTVLASPAGATATFEDDNPTCASIDGNTGAVVALTAGVANIGTAGAIVTLADGTKLPVTPLALTVTAVVAVGPDAARVVLN